MQGSKDLPTCETNSACETYMLTHPNRTHFRRSCLSRDFPVFMGCRREKYEEYQEELWTCNCKSDLCNNLDEAALKAKAATSSIPYHIAIAVVGAMLIAFF
ncbi:unnamed protein product, partial [Mesorhabditis spiculigera]